MEKNREVRDPWEGNFPCIERRGGKAAGELLERASVSGALSTILREDRESGLQG
jgi:hypothetical protein